MAEEETWLEKLPKYQPGDKIYKLFNHDKVLVKGKDNQFFIEIVKLKRK